MRVDSLLSPLASELTPLCDLPYLSISTAFSYCFSYNSLCFVRGLFGGEFIFFKKELLSSVSFDACSKSFKTSAPCDESFGLDFGTVFF